MAVPGSPYPERYVVVPFLGPEGVGKTTLLQGLADHVARRDRLPALPLRPVPVPGATATLLDVRTAFGFLQIVDFPASHVETAALAATRFQGAVLCVSALDSVTEGVARSLQHARRAGIPRMVVALTKCDAIDDPEMLDLVAMEIREQLSKVEYDGDASPVLHVAASREHSHRERRALPPAEFLDAVQAWVA